MLYIKNKDFFVKILVILIELTYRFKGKYLISLY